MTRRDFFAGNRTWKGVQLRALVQLNARPVTYVQLRRHIMINCKTMFVKSALMTRTMET